MKKNNKKDPIFLPALSLWRLPRQCYFVSFFHLCEDVAVCFKVLEFFVLAERPHKSSSVLVEIPHKNCSDRDTLLKLFCSGRDASYIFMMLYFSAITGFFFKCFIMTIYLLLTSSDPPKSLQNQPLKTPHEEQVRQTIVVQRYF